MVSILSCLNHGLSIAFDRKVAVRVVAGVERNKKQDQVFPTMIFQDRGFPCNQVLSKAGNPSEKQDPLFSTW